MPRNEQVLLALILAGMGAAAASGAGTAPATDARGPLRLGGAPPLGGLMLGVVACGDKDDDSGDTGDGGDGGGEDGGGGDGGGSPSGDGGVGRPFTVADEIRTAPVAHRRDWTGPADIDLADLDATARATLVRHFLAMAAGEHASVASFHRVALELLHLGAPPQLLLDTHQAASDEIRHAQVAFGLAERFSGQAHGPGPLDVRGALDVDLGPQGVMRRLVDEACVGETIGALWLREASQRTADPALTAMLGGIAQDEETHAALGWRTLRWLLGQHPELRSEARQRIEGHYAAAWKAGAAGDELEPFGRLAARTREAVRERAFLQVILPASGALG